MCDFYFQNKDLDLIAHELLCHGPYYKLFTLGYSCSFRKASPMINFEEALNHPLSTGPLSQFNADGSARKTSKNKLAPTLMSKSNEENADALKESTMYAVDLMALMQVITAIPETFQDLALKLTSILPNQRISTS